MPRVEGDGGSGGPAEESLPLSPPAVGDSCCASAGKVPPGASWGLSRGAGTPRDAILPETRGFTLASENHVTRTRTLQSDLGQTRISSPPRLAKRRDSRRPSPAKRARLRGPPAGTAALRRSPGEVFQELPAWEINYTVVCC